ncbi:MAG TPA: head GIN domain-containing protein [Puia sp.]|nr:head GIN domain-containing protein [Puia sp.]
MQKLIFALAACLVFSALTAQQTIIKDPNAQVRSVGSFHALKVATGIHLYLTQGNETAVAVSAADPEYRDRIRTVVSNGVLSIYYDNENWNWNDHHRKELKAYVSCTLLDGLHASSGAQVVVDGTLKTTTLNMDLSSGSIFTGKVEAEDLRVDEGSGARSTISGKASHLKAGASSGSSLNGFDLQADECDVRVSSGGRVDISVQKTMSASAHSGGHVNYQGTGVISEVHTSSGGSISRR